MKENNSVVITGATGKVGTFASLAFARLGVADDIYMAARNPHSLNDIFYNSQVNSLMRSNATKFHSVLCDIEDENQVAEVFAKIQPTLVINCAAGFSLFPFFPALRARQKRIGIIPGFAHTLPKDMLLLYPLMQGIRKSCPNTIVVNLAAPDIASYVLKPLGLSPDIGAGTLDSTSQGVRLKIANDRNISPTKVDVRMVAHHALRRYPANQVPFAIQIFVEGKDVTKDYTQKDVYQLVDFATGVTGVETEDSPVSNNSAVTASSAVETAYAILTDSGSIRHGSGLNGTAGAQPIRMQRNCLQPVLPNDMTPKEAEAINIEGMKFDGLSHVNLDSRVFFTEKEVFWIKEGLGLDWGSSMCIEDSKRLSSELYEAYVKMRNEEKA